MVRVEVLGPVRVTGAAGACDDLRPAGRALLARLALAAGRVVSAGHLIDDLWGEELPANPKGALRVTVSRTRKSLGDSGVLVWGSGGYRLAGVEVDADEFEALVAAGRQASTAGSPAEAAEHLARGLRLWRGEALADLHFAPFVVAHATRLEAERLAALEQRIAADLACGRHFDLLSELADLVSEHPLDEQLWAHRMVALYRCGRQADALRAYSDLRLMLSEQLGIEPAPSLRLLEESILLQRPELDAPAPVAMTSTPPPPSVPPVVPSVPAEATAPRLWMSSPLTALIGRVAELATVLAAIDRHRLVSLVGPAGVGKTRLAIEAAVRLRLAEFGDAVWVVELGTVTDPAAIADVIAAGSGTIPPAGADVLAAVAARLRDRTGLLFMDNCDQLRGDVAVSVERLLGACPDLTVLVTSRSPLGVAGEQIIRLAPLSIDDAVALFRERSGLPADHDPTATTTICRAVDGLPLAVELAAGLTRTLTVEQVASRIGDRFGLLTVGAPSGLPHHQTLRAALEWGYDLLGPAERCLYRRLAVFAGWWTLEAAEAVCGDEPLANRSVAPALARLVDASLVVVADAGRERRFSMLETMREFADERLDESGEQPALRQRHLEWCAQVAGRSLVEEGGHHDELEQEFANVRVAIETARGTDRVRSAAELILAVQRSWLMHGHLSDGRRLLLALAGDVSLPAVARASLYGHAANHFLHAGQLDEAELVLDQGLPFARAGRDRFILAENRYFRGILHIQRARVEPARDAFTEVLAIMRRLDRSSGVGAALDCLADIADLRGDHATAVRHRDVADAIDRQLGDDERLGTGLARRAIGAVFAGDLAEATLAADEALSVARSSASPMLTAWAMEAAGRLATARGDLGAARAAHANALAAYAEIGTEHDRCAVHLDLAAGACDGGDLGTAAEELVAGLPALVEAGVDRFVADGLDVAAAVLAGAGDDELAVRTAGAAGAFRIQHGIVASKAAQARFGRWSVESKGRLGSRWSELWEDTGRLSLREAALLALNSGMVDIKAT